MLRKPEACDPHSRVLGSVCERGAADPRSQTDPLFRGEGPHAKNEIALEQLLRDVDFYPLFPYNESVLLLPVCALALNELREARF